MVRPLLQLLAVLVALPSATSSVADLRALSDAGAWQELLERAQAIPPTERAADWRALVERAARERIADATLSEPDAAATATALLRAYPHLSESRAFLDVRATRGARDLERCLSSAPRPATCLDDARALAFADTGNSALAAEVARLVWRSTTNKALALPYFHLSLRAARQARPARESETRALCSSEELLAAAADALQHAAPERADPAAELAQAREVAFDWCWSQMNQAAFTSRALATDSGQRNACGPLLAKGALAGVRAAKCQRMVSAP